MPFEWVRKKTIGAPADTAGAPLPEGTAPEAELHLWPHRSLPRRGFVIFIAATCSLVAMPLLAVLGSPVLWGILPFLMIAVGGVWLALERSYRDGDLLEELRIWADRIELIRHDPRGRRQEWRANPYWTRVSLHAEGGPVPNYVTLKGDGREVEIGAFLSEDERLALYEDLRGQIRPGT